jgi:copper chaperone CopZ
MFSKNIFIALSVGVVLTFACEDQPDKDPGTETLSAKTLTISVGGMHCEGCNSAIESSLSTLDGVRSVEATFETGKVQIIINPATFELNRALEAIQDRGYETSADSVKQKLSRD